MRSVDSWLDRFAAKHPRLGVPNLMLYIVIGNVVIYLLDMFSGYAASDLLCFSAPNILDDGEVWRLVTFIFVPEASGNLFLFAISLYFYWLIGSSLEREWGSAKFTVFYLTGVLFNILTGLLVGDATMHYVNLSLFFAFATLYPDLQFLVFFFIPVKAKWLAWLDGAVFAWGVIQYLLAGRYLMALIPVVAVLNYVLFFWSSIAGLFRRGRARTRHQRSTAAVNFRAAQRKAKETKGYLHKCAVCGRTDADDPSLEFRYCSRCNGYYCYCMDHINSHVHIE